MNPNVSPKQQGVNKFDSFNYNMMFNPYMYMNMTRPGKRNWLLDLLKAHSYQNAEYDFQKLSLDEENNNNNDKNIVDAL